MSKRLLRAMLLGFCALWLALCMGLDRTPAHAAESRAECVVETSSGRILHRKNADMPLPMASTTKILTAIILLDDCAPDETVVIPHEAEGVEGSSVYLKAGEEYTVEELLYGLMLRSGNDCAVALAVHHSGSIEAFAQKMNVKAALLGAKNSHFVNPHGLPAKGHYTTAHDLALIAAYALENETFEKIVCTKYYAGRNWQNKNKMLWKFDGATGVKTGFTFEAGRCLVTAALRNGMRLVSVVLNSPQMYERSGEILEAAFGRYTLAELYREGDLIDGLAGKSGFSYPLTAEEREQIRICVEPNATPPERRGDFAGIMRIFLENNLIFSQNLYMME